VRVRVTEEAGKIDLNAAPAELLAALLQAPASEAAEAERLVAAIVDFSDEDRLPRPGGAEDPDYLRAGAPMALEMRRRRPTRFSNGGRGPTSNRRPEGALLHK
jgi:type II secretory pathway component PulK